MTATRSPKIPDAGPRAAVTRFAPSPTGKLHIGHAFSALMARSVARQRADGRYLLRIEDIDGNRSTQQSIDSIIRDLNWLGLQGDEPPLFQSTREPAYREALQRLIDQGLMYRCTCTRSDIAAVLKHKSVRHGPDGPNYPGTCRGRSVDTSAPFAWRLDMAKALAQLDLTKPFDWHELGEGSVRCDPGTFGDVVLWRKDAIASYHLAATVDDAFQGIDPVVRGEDLRPYTSLHRLLQELLGERAPSYWHHDVIIDPAGQKLAKSKGSKSLADYRAEGVSPAELLERLQSGKLPDNLSFS